MFILKQ